MIRLRRADSTFCPVCKKLVQLMTFGESAKFSGWDIEEITAKARGGLLHRLHNRKADVMICTDSLFAWFENADTKVLDLKFLSAEEA